MYSQTNSESVLQKENDQLFFKVKLRIRFRDKVLAGIPKGGKPLDYFMDARHMSDQEKEDFKKRISDGSLTEDEKTAIKEMNWCQFERDHAGNLSMWHGNVKAMMREIFVSLGLTQRRPQTKQPGAKGKKGKNEVAVEGEVLIPEKGPSSGGRQTFQHVTHVDPIHIPFERMVNGKLELIKVTSGSTEAKPESDPREKQEDRTGAYSETVDFMDKVKHIKDMNGTRSALGRHDTLFQPEMTIYLKWPADGVFTEEDMKKAWAACEDDGLGACRSQGFGKFNVIEWTVINDPKKKK